MTSSPRTAAGRFERLFSPIQVGPMLVQNRICETTNSIGAGRADGLPDEAFIDHHVGKARGGTAWLGGETWLLNSPMPQEAADEFFPGAASTRFPLYLHPDLPNRVRRFTEAAHEAGAVTVFQLTHLNFTMAASSIHVAGAYDWIPHRLDDEEIDFIINTYAEAAARFKEGGADGIEIHCAHETLPHTFLSPATNQRTDRWGGDAQRRTRFVIEVLERVRKRIGDGVALGIRMNGMESRPGGYNVLEMREMVSHIAESGLLDFLDLDVGHSWGVPSYVQPSYNDPAQFRDAARGARVDIAPIPVLFSGRVNDPVVAEDLLAGGFCDLVGMTRAGIADPEFANKARDGRMIEMRRCIGCNRCIGEAVHGRSPARKPACSVNPVAGNEALWATQFQPAAEKRRVVVVGGGAAGLEAARVSAMRGHHVVLLEQRPSLGGQVRIASKAPGRDSFEDFLYFQENQMAALGVEVRLGAPVTADDVLALSPDVVICATGSRPIRPSAPGIDSPHVVQGWDVLEGRAVASGRVAVISQEDHFETPNVADFLASRGCHVEVFHSWLGIGAEIDRYSIGMVMRRLEQGGVKVHTGQILAGIDGNSLSLLSAFTGERRTVDGFDSIVLVYGSAPDTTLHDELRGRVQALYLIGSAWVPRGIHEATEHGMKVALAV